MNQRSNCHHLLDHRESTGEGNGNPLQCSCLENPRDCGDWWAAVYGVAQSRTWLKWFSSSSSSRESKGNSRKTSTFASLTTLKSLTVWITTNYGKFLKRWEYQITWPAFWEICVQVKKQQLELDMEKWTGSKLGKSISRLYIITLLI